MEKNKTTKFRAIFEYLIDPLGRILSWLGLKKKYALVIYKIDGMGDWLMSYSSLNAIVEQASGPNVLLIASKESKPMRDEMPLKKSVIIEIPISPNSLREQIVKAVKIIKLTLFLECDDLVCLTHFDSNLKLLLLSRIKSKKIHKFPDVIGWNMQYDSKCIREILRHHTVLNFLGIEVRKKEDLLPRLARRASVQNRNIITVSPYGSSTIRDWGNGNWATVICALARADCEFEVWVNSKQMAAAHDLIALVRKRNPQCRIDAKAGSIGLLIEAVSISKLVLSVETLTAHFAVALDVALVALIGGGHFGEFAPWFHSDRQVWVFQRLECYSCQWSCKYDSVRCIKNISPSEMIRNAEKHLLSAN